MLIGSYAPDPEGGAERQCRRLSHSLKSHGFSVEIITFRHSRTRQHREVDKDDVIVNRIGRLGPFATMLRRSIEYQMMQIISSSDLHLSGVQERWARAVAFWLTLPVVWLARLGFIFEINHFAKNFREPFDLIHVHESGWLAGIGVTLSRRWHIPVICKEASAPALGPIGYDTPLRRTWSKKRLLANGWLAQTYSTQEQLKMVGGINPGGIHIINNGVLIPSEAARPESSKDVLYVGNFSQGSAWKAFDVLFEAWVLVANTFPGARLIVVGGGNSKPWIRTLKIRGIESSVKFMGHMEDLSQIYKSAGIFVLPSRIEGMSNALLEAMSWGLPCIVSDIPGNLAVIDHDLNGLVVKVNDSAGLAKSIIHLLNNPTIRSSMGSHARKKAKSNYDIEYVAEQLIQVYSSVLKMSDTTITQ